MNVLIDIHLNKNLHDRIWKPQRISFMMPILHPMPDRCRRIICLIRGQNMNEHWSFDLLILFMFQVTQSIVVFFHLEFFFPENKPTNKKTSKLNGGNGNKIDMIVGWLLSIN